MPKSVQLNRARNPADQAFPGTSQTSPLRFSDIPAADQARERIIATATERFFAHGFSTITMDDLACELGMSKKTLYRHFRTKDELLEAVIRAKAADIRQTLETVVTDPGLSYSGKLRAVTTNLTGKLSKVQPVFLHNLKKYAPARFRQVDQIRRENFSRIFGNLLEQGRRQGEIRKDLNIPFTIELVLGAFHSILASESLDRLQLTPAQAMQMTLDLLFAGILTQHR